MSKVVVAAGPDDTLQDAVGMLHDHRISALPVSDGRDRCVGILTATDLIDITRELDAGLHDLSQVSDVSRQWLLEALTRHDLGRQKVAERMTG
ncbi:MAG: CBS domain-containing protein, partial [Planctomycetales bacterium]|nr:CBS domain-containing protein [Planctomycetales bacterium]